MNEKDLFRAIGGISDDFITEAAVPAKKARRISVTKIIAIAAALVMFAGISTWAANVILSGRSGHSRSIPDYYRVPSQETLQKDIGIAPNIPDGFSNGFVFEGGHIVENEDYAEDGSVFESYKALNCNYRKGNERIALYTDASAAGNQMDEEETAEVYRGSEIKYFAYTNKLVPGNYQMTEQDKADEKSGRYVFSYGSAEVEISEVQILGWECHGLNYSLCANDSSLDKAALLQMTREVIDAQNGGAQ